MKTLCKECEAQKSSRDEIRENMGTLAVQVRMTLVNIVVMPNLLYNAEIIPKYSSNEIKELERIQHSVLTQLLNIPRSTPNVGVLMETGMWTMQARLDYKKLMLYHNIKNSENERVIKQIVDIQEEETRSTTWVASVREIMKKYGIELEVKSCLKSKLKKEVKKIIQKNVEDELKTLSKGMEKMRTVADEKLQMEEYLKKLQ